MTSPVVYRLRRRMLEQWIEDAIALLDKIDGDPELEDCESELDMGECDYPLQIWGGQGL